MSPTNSAPLLLIDIAERWATYSGAGSADQILSDLLKAIWRGEFADSALMADPRCVMDALFPEGHSESPPDLADEEMARTYIAECLANSPDFTPECAMGQVLHAVLFGRSEIVDGKPRQTAPYDSTILASYSISDYSPGQRKIIECLKLTPDGLALWLHQSRPQEPHLTVVLGLPANVGDLEAGKETGFDTSERAENHSAATGKRKFLSYSQSEEWYLRRIDECTALAIIPSRADDDRDGMVVGIPTTRMRMLRKKLAPEAWRRRGRRKTGKEIGN
jgi:hypothetical protein